jgi:hypothetical protein
MPKSMGGLTTDDGGSSEIIDLPVEPRTQTDSTGAPTPAGSPPNSEPVLVPWYEFLQNASTQDVKNRFAKEVGEILNQYDLGGVCCLALIEPVDSIDNYDLDKIYAALMNNNPAHAKDVVLFLLSTGGAGEPAYQISKICKFFSKSSFKVIVPRIAKSAATLIAIGADEIHMSLLARAARSNRPADRRFASSWCQQRIEDDYFRCRAVPSQCGDVFQVLTLSSDGGADWIL